MIGQDKAFSILERILSSSKADAAEAVLVAGTNNTTRYANSVVHQNVSVDFAKVTFRVALGTRVGTASCTSLAGPDLRRALRSAMDVARRQKPSPDFPGFAPLAEYRSLPAWDQATARVTPRARARKLATVFARGARHSYAMFGSLATREVETAVVATTGARCYQPGTTASLTCIATGPDSSGYASAASRQFGAIDVGATASIAVEKCRRSKSPKDLPPRVYEVILEPAAVAEIFAWLAFIGFGSKGFEEKSSFLAGRIGERVMGENVTILDDAFNPACLGLPFDCEGTPRQSVRLVEKGIARGVVHNRLSARKAGGASTGHALAPELAAEGSYPLYLHMEPGTEAAHSLIGQVEDGLLVTRFHYLNGYLDTRKAMMTGMTRDGLMRIRRGRLAGGVKNLRFTDSMMEVFSKIAAISAERAVVVPSTDDLGSLMYLPTLRVRGLAFTGATEF